MSCSTSNTKTKTCNKIVMLHSVRNVTEVLLDRQCFLCSLLEPICIIATPYSLASRLVRFSSLHTCFPFTSPLFFFLHYPRCKTLPVKTRNCRLLQRHFRDVALTPARITVITLSRMTCAGSHFCPVICTRSRQRRSKRSRR